jgi:hypothetical protein
MAAACSEMHNDKDSATCVNIQEVMRLLAIRKDASTALKRQDSIGLSRSPMKSINPGSTDSDGFKSSIRVNSTRHVSAVYVGQHPATSTSLKTEGNAIQVSRAELQQFQSGVRSRPAYASAGKISDTIVLDQNIVIEWANYIQTHSIPRDAPSIPLSLNVGVAVPPGFETHYKVAAFALAKSRQSLHK